MWQTKKPKPAKLIIGILGADEECLKTAIEAIRHNFGEIDLVSDSWQFNMTAYYKEETGEHILKQFVSVEKPVEPGELAAIKHKTNAIEQELAQKLEKKPLQAKYFSRSPESYFVCRSQ